MTKYVVTIVTLGKSADTSRSFVTRHHETVDETESLLKDDEIMFVNEWENRDLKPQKE